MAFLPLPTIPAGADVFSDANILIYGLTGKSQECADFIRRCARGEISVYVSADVLSDVVHRVILVDASIATGRPHSHRTLKADKALVRGLTSWRTKVSSLLALPLIVDDVRLEDVAALLTHIPAMGLLGKDALIVHSMSSFGLNSIATNDADFDGLGLTVYAPTDVTP